MFPLFFLWDRVSTAVSFNKTTMNELFFCAFFYPTNNLFLLLFAPPLFLFSLKISPKMVEDLLRNLQGTDLWSTNFLMQMIQMALRMTVMR